MLADILHIYRYLHILVHIRDASTDACWHVDIRRIFLDIYVLFIDIYVVILARPESRGNRRSGLFMAYIAMAYIVIAYIVMAYVVMALHSYSLCSYGPT